VVFKIERKNRHSKASNKYNAKSEAGNLWKMQRIQKPNNKQQINSKLKASNPKSERIQWEKKEINLEKGLEIQKPAINNKLQITNCVHFKY
jgi:hypothetical protein